MIRISKRFLPAIRSPASVLAMVCILSVPALPHAVSAQAESSGQEVEQAVVLIEATIQRGDWFTPWQRTPILHASGSGFLLDKGLIMTNAHVVSDAKQIIVRRNGRIAPSFARVEFIAHDADLALLRVDDAAFDEGVAPLELGPMPNLRTRVRTYGYPMGGEKISRTEGVVSRVEFITYMHSGADAHIGIQTDSAINPGNSGGPVMQDGKVVGVAFQTNTRLNDVGFFIPTPVIRRFLEDISDGTYDGYGELGIITSNLINPSYREYLGLPPEATGVVVDRLIKGASAEAYVKVNDVITAIDGVPVAIDGTIDYHRYTIGLEQIAEDKQLGETVELAIWRDRAPRTIRIPLMNYPDAERLRFRFDQLPRYVVYAGLVFMELDQEYLKTFGNYWQNADKALLYNHFYRAAEDPDFEGKRTILISRVLPHEVNSAYRRYANTIVATVNGLPVTDLEMIPDALKNSNSLFLVIELEDGRKIILDREEAERAHPVILDTYGIRQDQRLP